MRARWKRVSVKKLSTRKRGVFRDKRHATARILSSGETLSLPSGEVKGHEPSVLPCLFLTKVLCSFRKDSAAEIMGRCFNCPHYKRFMEEMEKEDKETMDEFDEIRRTGVHP